MSSKLKAEKEARLEASISWLSSARRIFQWPRVNWSAVALRQHCMCVLVFISPGREPITFRQLFKGICDPPCTSSS